MVYCAHWHLSYARPANHCGNFALSDASDFPKSGCKGTTLSENRRAKSEEFAT